MKRTTIILNEQQNEMIDRINKNIAGTSLSGAIKYALFYTDSKLNPPYLNKTPKQQRTPEEQAEYAIKIEEAKKNAKKNVKLKIAEKLGAKLIDNGNENISVQWYTYHSTGKDMQEMPLMSLTEDLISNQFQGNLEKIKAYHKLK